MKKFISLIITFFLILSVSVTAFAADKNANIGGKSVPFNIQSDWYCSTVNEIDSHFTEIKGLSEELIRDYMRTFDYRLWFINKKNGNEIIVQCAAAKGVKDYKKMTADEINSAITAEISKPYSLDNISVAKIEKYPSAGVLFVKYSVNMDNSLYMVRYDTVVNNVSYQIKIQAGGGKITDSNLKNCLSVADTVAVALTFPSDYSDVTVTATETAKGDGSIIIDLETDPSFTGNSIGAADITDNTAPSASSAVTSSLVPADSESAMDNSVITGSNGETFVIEETYPSDTDSSHSLPYIRVFAAVCVVAVAAAVIFAVIKRKMH